jgi:hypothetical protein
LRSFIIAYLGKTIASLISLLMQAKKKRLSPAAVLKIFVEEDTLRFAIFPTLYALI